jgi:pimeloyl-ACP methyl ester carboxylesterase
MPNHPTTHQLDVSGGRLHYEVRGSGPLLFVVGQPMTSAPFGPLADVLADQYTVVTYDPHGLGQSSVDDPSLDVTPEIQADDLAQLVDAVGSGPAEVFASSGGAVAGLALVARHPDKVRVLIAHEPPVTELLPDAPYVRAVVDDVEDAYRDGGSGAAWGKFVSLVMYDGLVTEAGIPPSTWPPAGEDAAGVEDSGRADSGSTDPGQEQQVPSEKQRADDELFFLRMLKPFTRYEPSEESLRSGQPRVVIAVGEASGGAVASRSAVALAERLGISTTTFPGDHGGFMADPEGFASAIRQALS